jgi:tetratricopeptide (TPR) repeat protein
MESRSAIDRYHRALALAGPEEEWGPREGRILAGIGESRYWMGEYDDGQRTLERALAVAGPDPWTRTHALRFLADITLNVRGDPERADDLFDQALAAAREHGDQWAMARTLLMAGWAPYWKHDLASARERFEEALRLARAGPRHDMLSESRALTSLVSVTSPVGTEDECLTLGQQAMDVAMEAGDPFSVAVAQGYLANSLRRMLELDRAATYVAAAVRIFADLDARWEHASTLHDRATIRRLQGRFEDAERDLLGSLSIARSMAEPNLVASAAGSLVYTVAASGDRERAMSTFRDLRDELAAEPSFPSSLYSTESTIALLEGDRDRALGRALLLLERQREVGWANHLAGEVWWVGRVFGPDAVGGQDDLDRAGEQLQRAGWLHQLSDPDRFLEVYPDLAPAPAAEAR